MKRLVFFLALFSFGSGPLGAATTSENAPAAESTTTTAGFTGSTGTGAVVTTTGPAAVDAPAATFSAGDLTTGTVVSPGGVFVAPTAEEIGLRQDLSRIQRQFLVEQQPSVARPDVSGPAQTLGTVQTFRNNVGDAGVSSFTAGNAAASGVTTVPIPVGGTTAISTTSPLTTTDSPDRVATAGTLTAVPVGSASFPAPLVSLEENRPANSAPARPDTRTLVGRAVFVDTPRSEITVRDDVEGANRTFVASPEVVATVEEGALIKVDYRVGSDTAENIAVKQESER